jgi:hypothetical protein
MYLNLQSYLGSGLSDGNTLFGRHSDAADSLFLDSGNDRGRPGASNSYEQPPPGFSSDMFSGAESSLSSSAPRHFKGGGASSYLGSMDRKMIGENIVRSHSAAPSLDGRLSLGPPPGLGSGSRETPLTSNRTNDSYLESTVDSSHIFQLGQRRPASTGVIGGHQNSSSAVLNSLGLCSTRNNGGAVRPAAKTLMDLIQEDFPPESPIEGDPYTTNGYPNREDSFLERPRTTSPLSQPSMRDTSYLYRNQNEASYRHENGGRAESLNNRIPLGPGDRYPQAVSTSTNIMRYCII